MNESNNRNYNTIIIGAGQAGLSAGYYLKKLGLEFVILTKDSRIGDNWRKRWDSLRLFTPVFFNHLPGMNFPSDNPDYLPDKNETADFLEIYCRHFNLPVLFNREAFNLEMKNNLFCVETNSGNYIAHNVIVATGSFQNPHIPDFAKDINGSIFQIHSSRYTNPGQLNKGGVLVVGAGSSGLQIAAEIAEQSSPGREVWLSGPDTGTFPRQILGIDIYHILAPTVFHVPLKSFPGRIIKSVSYRHGDLVLKPTYKKTIKAGVKRVGRTVRAEHGFPVIENNIQLKVGNVIWCTGFRHNFDWIKLDIFDDKGRPVHNRGVINKMPGIYFLGLHFQHTLSSSLLGGVRKDAEFITSRLS